MNVRPNGIGGSSGDQLATCRPLQLSGDVWYVSSLIGTDAASPAGKDRQKPLATLSQAHTNAVAGDIVVLMDGHTETLVAVLTISKAGLDIVGEGQSSGLPTAQLKINAAAASVLNVTGAAVRIRNILFPASIQSNTGSGGVGKVHINASASKSQVIGCYFQEGANDQLAAVSVQTGATDVRVENATFISTAPTTATRPTYGLLTQGTVTDLDVAGCVFSDGTVGFSSAAWDSSAGVVTRLRAQNVSLLLGADAIMNAATTGWLNVQTATDGGRVVW